MDGSENELIEQTARLARLSVTQDDARRLGPQFARILDHFQVLAELDIEHVEPLSGSPTRVENVTRADEPRADQAEIDLLRNAPDARDGFYGVPKTLGGDS